MADTLWTGYGDNKLYLQSGQFTATLKDSEAIGTVDATPTGISIDPTNTPWSGSEADKLYLQSGKFTSTLKASEDVSGIDIKVNDISWDGTNTPWSGYDVPFKLYLQSGQFTSTIKESADVALIDIRPMGISWNTTDTPWIGTADDKLYMQSGQITSTLKDSQDINSIDATPSGIDVTNRIGGTEYPRTVTSTLVIGQDIDSSGSMLSRAVDSTAVFGQNIIKSLGIDVVNTITAGQSIDPSSSIFNRTPSDTLVLTDGAYPTHESELMDILVFSQLVSAETALTECSGKRHWPRWIFASAAKHFDSNISLPFFIEGTQRLTDDEQKHVEFRIEGPDVIELSHNYYRLDVMVNVLWSFNQDNEDFHETERIKGILINSMCDICIYRYGSGAFDDDSLLGILELSQGVKVNNFGQVRQDVRLLQGSVEGTYRMYLNCN